MKFKSESELARYVIEWLEASRWDVYQEVQPSRFGKTADIVAVQGKVVWIIECKTSFGLTVIAQARHWKYRAHYVSVAVPKSSKNTHDEYGMASEIVKKFGIGHLAVSEFGQFGVVKEIVSPALFRKAPADEILKVLKPEHKTYAAAGNSNGLRWTPFQQTCRNVLEEVRRNPGLNLKSLISRIDTHYHSTSTARSCLRKYIEDGIVAGVRMEKARKEIRLYPEV